MVKTTEKEIERWMNAMPAEHYDIRAVWHDKKDRSMKPINRKIGGDKVPDLISFFKAENAKGYNIVGRATDFRYIFLDDLSKTVWDEMISDGFRPCVVVESSPGNYQAFLDAGSGTEEFVAKALARAISARYGADPGSADAHHLGRIPGFTNRKTKHRRDDGTYPYASLRTASRRVCPVTTSMRTAPEIVGLAASYEAQEDDAWEAWEKEQASPRAERAALAENETLRVSGDGTQEFRAIRAYEEGIRFFTSQYGADLDRSRADYGVARRMMNRGFSDESIVKAVTSGEKAQCQQNPLMYAIHTVQKVKASFRKNVDEEPETPSPLP